MMLLSHADRAMIAVYEAATGNTVTVTKSAATIHTYEDNFVFADRIELIEHVRYDLNIILGVGI